MASNILDIIYHFRTCWVTLGIAKTLTTTPEPPALFGTAPRIDWVTNLQRALLKLGWTVRLFTHQAHEIWFEWSIYQWTLNMDFLWCLFSFKIACLDDFHSLVFMMHWDLWFWIFRDLWTMQNAVAGWEPKRLGNYLNKTNLRLQHLKSRWHNSCALAYMCLVLIYVGGGGQSQLLWPSLTPDWMRQALSRLERIAEAHELTASSYPLVTSQDRRTWLK